MPEIFHGQELPIKVYRDGDQWCALLGEDLPTGTAGFGDDPIQAVTELWGRLGYGDKTESVSRIEF